MKKGKKREAEDANFPMLQQKRTTVVIENDPSTIASTETTLTSTYQPQISQVHIPLNELEIGKEIGEGTYGRVCVGKWKKYRVALKFCRNRGKVDEFLREANLMSSLPPHPNVVRMYGVSIDGTQPIIVMEYCAGGSLDHLLYDKDQPISNEQKMKWVVEIAQGMCHLHKYNIVHRDLAARNILLSQSNPNDAILKISDFGMSRVLQHDIQNKTKSTVGPVCWMAPESIENQVYSKKSDVWMFGILVYEIVSRKEPHAERDPMVTSREIKTKGLTPEIPNDCPQRLRILMEQCWQKQPEQRPTFEIICQMLRETFQ